MPVLTRRGFTLIELMIALVLLGIVSMGIYRVLVSNQRIYRAQTQRIDLQQNIRAAATILPAEFRELDAFDGDIKAMASDSIKIRAMRQLAIMCSPPVLGGVLTGRQITVRDSPFFGSRNFNPATDSLLLYYEGDEASRNDDSWWLARLTAVGTAPCPAGAGGGNGRLLTADMANAIPPQVNAAGNIQTGSPLRGFEIVTYRLYQAADGLWYVGLRNAGGLQPVVGPLSGSGGLTFTYYDGTGTVTAVPTSVAEIEIRVRARTAQTLQMPSGGQVTPVDSIVTRVSLRNNRRF